MNRALICHAERTSSFDFTPSFTKRTSTKASLEAYNGTFPGTFSGFAQLMTGKNCECSNENIGFASGKTEIRALT